MLLALKEPKKGTGFDNFTPKNGSTDNNDNKNKEEDKNQNRNSFFGGNNNSNNNHDPNDPNRWENWFAAAVMLLLTYALVGRGEDNNNASGGVEMNREISWHDFLTLLQKQQVVKILVSEDRQTARIYLKPHATGLTHLQQQHGANNNNTSLYERRRQQSLLQQPEAHQPAAEAALAHDDSQSTFSSLESSSSSTTASSSGGHVPFYYSMQVGSVDAFERKVDEAQRALKRPPEQDVPIQYLPSSVRI